MHRESVKPTGQTPTHTTFMVIRNGHKNDLTTPNQVTTRQHHRVQQMPSIHQESVKSTGQTPTFTGYGHNNDLTRPRQTPQARILTTTERPHREMNKFPVLPLPPLAGAAAFKTHKPRVVTGRVPLQPPAPASAPAPAPARLRLPQLVIGRIAPVNRSSERNLASSKKKQPCKDQPQKPVRLLAVADFPPVSESVRALMCRIADQQHSERQRAAVKGSVPRRAAVKGSVPRRAAVKGCVPRRAAVKGCLPRAQCEFQDPEMTPGDLIDCAKYVGNFNFNVWRKVRRSVSYRTHTWDVDVEDNTSWMVGVATESVQIKGTNGLPSGVWCIGHVSQILWSLTSHYLDLRNLQ
ncbi:unnamed protein product [Leuciscus chuanchicus]